jgi:hypothetical protein
LAHLRVPGLLLEAEVLAEGSEDKSTVEAAYRTAINCARDQEARYYELQATIAFARWLKAEDRGMEAEKMLSDVYTWFTEGSETAALKDAQALLSELRDQSDAAPRDREA